MPVLSLPDFYALLHERMKGRLVVPYLCGAITQLCRDLKYSNIQHEKFLSHFQSQLPSSNQHQEFYDNEYFVGEGTGKLGYIGFGWWSDYPDHIKQTNNQRVKFVLYLSNLKY